MGRVYTLPPAIAVLALAATLVAAATASRARTEPPDPVPLAAAPATTLVPRARLAARPRAHPARSAHRRHARAHDRRSEVLAIRRGRTVELRSRPKGGVVARIRDHTDFGSPTVLAVAAHRGSWVGVTTTNLPNGQLGWLKPRSSDVTRRRVGVEIVVSLSRRSLSLKAGRRTVRTVAVAIGRPGSETPKGRFAVTDRISGAAFGPYYGCCILALSGHQPHTPAGWQGGDRLAIHGTDSPGVIGTAVTAGCLRASDSDLHVLMQRVPLGTPVVIRG
ncbi:MAG: L,D-transpeptidase [Actinobacteria bacterium]|nr:MAG: L,D-transpeptidase [Actinomycetota bacterium]